MQRRDSQLPVCYTETLSFSLPYKNGPSIFITTLAALSLSRIPETFPSLSRDYLTCMAANLQGSRGLANLGKRLAGQIRSRDSAAISQLHRRSVHSSAYDKNPEENVVSTVVPDHVIPPQPEQYWAPHPKTGVFGPATDEAQGSGHDPGVQDNGDEGSVLEQKAFFRPLEDLEKPPVQP